MGSRTYGHSVSMISKIWGNLWNINLKELSVSRSEFNACLRETLYYTLGLGYIKLRKTVMTTGLDGERCGLRTPLSRPSVGVRQSETP